MAGPGRRTLYKPEPLSSARELSARGATNPEVTGDLAAARDAAGERTRHAGD
jgi:hypothetical protein